MDPFLTDHPSITPLPSERIRHLGAAFTVKPYILPHRDCFANEAQYEAAGGPGGWAARQGFYVYRGRRMIVPGSWLGLGGARAWTRDELSRLASIEIDLPTGMDREWRIDVRKSQARPPGMIRNRLTAIAARCRQQAREVFAWRGQGPIVTHRGSDAPPIWTAQSTAGATRYRIDRKHPAIAVLLKQDGADPKFFDAVLSIIERTVPVERIWLDVSEAEGAPLPAPTPKKSSCWQNSSRNSERCFPRACPPANGLISILRNLPPQPDQLRTRLVRRMEAA